MDINKDNIKVVRFTFQYCKFNLYIKSKSIAYKFNYSLSLLNNKSKFNSLSRKIGRYLGFFCELGFLVNLSKTGRGLYKKTELFPNTFKEFLKTSMDYCNYRSKVFKQADFKRMSAILDNISDSDFYLKVLGNDQKALEIFYNMRFL